MRVRADYRIQSVNNDKRDSKKETLARGVELRLHLEVQVTHTKLKDPSAIVPCRVERLAPGTDWGKSWLTVCIPGLSPEMCSFLCMMLHCILPTQDRLHRMNMTNASSTIFFTI